MSLLSKRHHLMIQLHDLRSLRSRRDQNREVAIFGRKLVGEWLNRQGTCRAIFRTPECEAFTSDDHLVDIRSLEWASGMVTSPKEGCAAIIPMPKNELPPSAKRVLLLDGVQDPGNVGALVRSALAFHFDALVAVEPSCDPWNDKALRASVGSSLYLPIWRTSREELFSYLDQHKPQLLIAEALENSQDVSLHELTLQPISWLVIGNESVGVSRELAMKGQSIHLPISKSVESLNAAVAGSILAYLLSTKKASAP